MDLRSYSEKDSKPNEKKTESPKNNMNEADVRRAINFFSKMSNEQLTRELSKHLSAKKAQGKENEIIAVLERIKPFLNDEQKKRLSEIMENYFRYYLNDRIKVMAYPLSDSDSMFSLLSINHDSYERYARSNKYDKTRRLIQAFKTANEIFTPIEITKSVIVPFNDESRKIIYSLCSDTFDGSPMKLLRCAQRYSVNLHEKQFEFMKREGLIAKTNAGDIYFLLDGKYSETYGIDDQTKMETIMV